MSTIVRTLCFFTRGVTDETLRELARVADLLTSRGYTIQTQRICCAQYVPGLDRADLLEKRILLGFGSLTLDALQDCLGDFNASRNKTINLDLSHGEITTEHVDVLFDIVEHNAANTFRFTYGFNLPESSPFFPSARYGRDGFAIGLQSTDLAAGSTTLEQWCADMQRVWSELDSLLSPTEGYLGIDSSVAPLSGGDSSFVNFVRRATGSFDRSATTDFYTRLSAFLKAKNPRPIGLCGIMLPCLEDSELADEYERGNFSIERNTFLSLHSGLGIDAYPVGVDEDRSRVVEILKLLQALGAKYHKPLSARFVSDGKAKIGQHTDFKNQYLKDVLVRKL